jgi:hypothetical protein
MRPKAATKKGRGRREDGGGKRKPQIAQIEEISQIEDSLWLLAPVGGEGSRRSPRWAVTWRKGVELDVMDVESPFLTPILFLICAIS